jgi:Flp pilus assembly protein TadG
MSALRKPKTGKRRGQSLVELALLTPVLCLIMLGTIDLGRMYFTYTDLKAASRNGARYGALAPTDYAGMQSRVLSSGVPAGTTASASCAGTGCTTIGAEGTVIVTASSNFSPITIGFFSFLGSGGVINLSATAKMRVLS